MSLWLLQNFKKGLSAEDVAKFILADALMTREASSLGGMLGDILGRVRKLFPLQYSNRFQLTCRTNLQRFSRFISTTYEIIPQNLLKSIDRCLNICYYNNEGER